MSDFNPIFLEPLLIIAGLVAFAVWQFRDLRRAREQTRRAREEAVREGTARSSPAAASPAQPRKD